MIEKLFVLGCSGSGKSTVSRCIEVLAHDRGWSAHSMNDYRILYEMFLADKKGEKFRPANAGGFDVLNEFVYDAALDELSKQAHDLTNYAKRNELVVIEFARCDYREALKHFGHGFLHNSSFLFLDADVDTCMRRVNERIARACSLDDHFVPDHVIDCFGQKGCKLYIESDLKLDYGIADHKVQVLDTRGSIKEVADYVEYFVANLLPILAPPGL